MCLSEDCRNPIGERAVTERAIHFQSVQLSGILTREPMVRLAQQIIAHPAPGGEVERFSVGPYAQDFQNIALPGHLEVLRHPLEPPGTPIRSQFAFHLASEPSGNRVNRLRDSLVVIERADVFFKIIRFTGAATERVDLLASQAVEVVELHRREWRAKSLELAWRLVQLPAPIVGADDENSHVAGACSFDCRPVQVVHEIPMYIEIIEITAFNGFQYQVGGGMGGKTDEPYAAIFLKLSGGSKTAVPFH